MVPPQDPAVRPDRKDGSIIIVREADEDEANEGEEDTVLSFNPASAASLAQWIRQQAKEGA